MGFDAATLLQLVKLSVTVLILAIGMQSTVDDLTYLWRRPWLLTKSMLAMYVFVPLAAVALARVLPVPFGLKVAVVVVAISAGAPLVPRKLMPLSNDGYVFSVIATSSLLAIVTVPLWLIALSSLSGATPEITPAEFARLLGKAFLLPLAIGMGFRMLAPDLSERLADILLKAGGVVLTLGGLVLLVLGWPLLKEAGWISLLVLGLLTTLALAIGHLAHAIGLGPGRHALEHEQAGLDPGERVAQLVREHRDEIALAAIGDADLLEPLPLRGDVVAHREDL